jgi:hypothetical protein
VPINHIFSIFVSFYIMPKTRLFEFIYYHNHLGILCKSCVYLKLWHNFGRMTRNSNLKSQKPIENICQKCYPYNHRYKNYFFLHFLGLPTLLLSNTGNTILFVEKDVKFHLCTCTVNARICSQTTKWCVSLSHSPPPSLTNPPLSHLPSPSSLSL